MSRLGLLCGILLLAGCKGAGRPEVKRTEDPRFDSGALRISYFRFDQILGTDGTLRRIGSAWVVYTKSWRKRFGENVSEPYIQAFPQGNIMDREKWSGVVLGKGVHPDGQIHGYVGEFIRRGLLDLPRVRMNSISKAYARRMHKDDDRWKTFRVISVASDRGSLTVLYSSVLKDEELAKKFIEVEKYVVSVVSRLAPVVKGGISRD